MFITSTLKIFEPYAQPSLLLFFYSSLHRFYKTFRKKINNLFKNTVQTNKNAHVNDMHYAENIVSVLN